LEASFSLEPTTRRGNLAMKNTEKTSSSYSLKALLGAGGMGVTYLAAYEGVEGFQKQVVLKKLPAQWSQSSELMNSLMNEARLSIYLNHPNIVSFWSFERLEQEYAIVMEYVDGCTVSSLIRARYGLPPEVVIYIVMQTLLALDYAHNLKDEQGEPMNLVHRDISPDNLLLSREGHVKLADFGLARFRDQLHHTQPGTIKGKFGYLSPEQARGETVDHRSDLYTLGILLYEGLTGQTLFAREHSWRALQSAMNPNFTPIQEALPQIDPVLASIVQRALSPEPTKRYPHARAFFDALEACILPQTQEKLRRITADCVRQLVAQPNQQASNAPSAQSSGIFAHPSAQSSPLLQVQRRPIVYLLANDSLFDESLTRRLVDPWSNQKNYQIQLLENNDQINQALRALLSQQRVPIGVIFGGLHVALEHPFLQALKDFHDVHKVLVLAEAQPELLRMAIELCGISTVHLGRPSLADIHERLRVLEQSSATVQRLQLLQRNVEHSSVKEAELRDRLSALADANLHATQLIEELQLKNSQLEGENIRLERSMSSSANYLGISPEETLLQGELRHIHLSQLLRTLSEHDDVFCTHFLKTDDSLQAMLYSQGGDILDVRLGSMCGEEALEALLGWHNAHFFVRVHKGPLQRSMQRQLDLKLLAQLQSFYPPPEKG
jgi:serine/threonine protein kinase